MKPNEIKIRESAMGFVEDAENWGRNSGVPAASYRPRMVSARVLHEKTKKNGRRV